MADCLIISPQADEYAALVKQLCEAPVELQACRTAAEALSAYNGQTVLFGSPDLIAEVLPRMPAVDWVQSSWAGVTPLINTPRRDYRLTGIKAVFGPQISEYVFGYLLAHELRLQSRLAAQREARWMDDESGMLYGKRMGVLGTGSIGQHIAMTAGHFNIKVVGLSRSGDPCDGFLQVYQATELAGFLQNLDYVVAVLPQTPATDRLLDAAALEKLPTHSYLINVGRGNVIDDEALVAALQRGELAGAVLDVFDVEPLPAHSPLWTTPRLLVTGHVAAMSRPELIVPIFVDNYRRYVAGDTLQHTVDFDAGY